MPNKDEHTKGTDKAPGTKGSRLLQAASLVFSILVFLALLSYDARDSDYLAQGVKGSQVIYNWIGYFGASVSRGLILLLGFSAYLLAALCVLSSARRLLGRTGLRPTTWDYWASILLTAIGAAMFCGIWPDFAAHFAEGLNIGATAGGVIGQRFCGPQGGWMRIILNPAGSAIVSLALVIVGMVVVWIYDWHGLFLERQAKRVEGQADKPATSKRSFLAERRAERLARRREKELAEAEVPPPKPKKATVDKDPVPSVARENGLQVKKTVSAKEGAVPVPEYVLPGLDLLSSEAGADYSVDPKEIEAKKEILQETLDSFGIDAQVGNATSGPRVTLFEVLPAPGVKVERISQISNNIAMELRATSLRILTPIPGKKSVGIEVPNTKASIVSIHSLMADTAWSKAKARIPVLLGRNISGEVVVLDLAKAPHLLIAGATGSGKSVCMNGLIMSMLYRFKPEELRLLLVDPKVVEFRVYQDLPHLVVPVISDTKKIPLALRWLINEMERRYHLFANVGARNLESFNKRPKSKDTVLDDEGKPIPEKLPYIVLVIDELADIMMTAKADVETSLARIAQLSRAVGIHTIVATQRPSVNVITGTIKANFPTRIAFKVTSQVDSRTILDGKGAEALLGQGDMLFRPPGAAGLERNQGALVEDDEIERVVEFCATQREPEFDRDVFKVGTSDVEEPNVPGGGLSEEDEQLVQQAIEVIVRDRRATTSYLQRCMRIGYNRAAAIIETLEQRGIIGPQIGTAPREILILRQEDVDDAGSDEDEDEDEAQDR